MNDSRRTTEDLVERAQQLEEAGCKREALEHWRAAISTAADVSMLCQYADLAAELREWAEAENAYLVAIRLSPDIAELYGGLGVLYLERSDRGDLERAIDCFKRRLQIEETPGAFTLLGSVQDRLGMTTEARQSFDQAIRLDRNYEEAYYNLAVTYRDEDRPKASALFRRALELDPDYQAAHRELGWALRWSNKYREGEYHIRRALALDESDGWAYIYLGNLLWGKHDLLGAERAFLKAIEIWPDDSTPCWCLGIFYEYTDRPPEADLFYEKAVQLDPDDPQANMRFGLYLKETGYPTKAKAHLERALALDPENERARSALAELDLNARPTGDVHKTH